VQSREVVPEDQRLAGKGEGAHHGDEEDRVEDQERGKGRKEPQKAHICRHQLHLATPDSHNYIEE
jgi:hypothetical protein